MKLLFIKNNGKQIYLLPLTIFSQSRVEKKHVILNGTEKATLVTKRRIVNYRSQLHKKSNACRVHPYSLLTDL